MSSILTDGRKISVDWEEGAPVNLGEVGLSCPFLPSRVICYWSEDEPFEQACTL